MHVRVYACTHVSMYACMHVRMYARTHVQDVQDSCVQGGAVTHFADKAMGMPVLVEGLHPQLIGSDGLVAPSTPHARHVGVAGCTGTREYIVCTYVCCET